jgi:hypothetical protein
MQLIHISRLNIGAKTRVDLNRYGRGLAHRNLRIVTILSSSFPSECSTDPLLAPPDLATVNNHHLLNITNLSFQFIKEGVLYVSGIYYSTSTVGYQLRIADLPVKVVHLSKDNIRKSAYNLSSLINKTLYVMHKYITYNKIK